MRRLLHERTFLSVTDESDETIWRRVVAGEARAYGLIWDRHHNRVSRHLIKSGHQPADAEDLTAMAFLELWRRRWSVRFVNGSLLPWLIVTARNVSHNAKRAQRRYSRLLAELPPNSPVPDPADEISDRYAAIHILRHAVAAARGADGDLLAMTVIDGFSIREAAAALGMSESAAKSRLSRFRAQLRTALGSELSIEEGA